jgi:hypothetical protein
MKAKPVLFVAGLLCASLRLSAAIDLEPGFNYSYNPPAADGVITDITIDVVNNGSSYAFSFDVSMYLYEPNSQTVYVIGTQSVNGLSANSLITISNWDIDINNTPNIPSGTYRLGVWVDSDDDNSESDEDNNAALLSGNISYTASANGINGPDFSASTVKVMPNPANAFSNLSFTLNNNTQVTVELYDITGKLVKTVVDKEQMNAGVQKVNMETETLPAGVYFWTLSTGELKVTRRLIVSH